MENILMFAKKHQKVILGITIVFTYPLIYIFVYYTGGIKYVYSHTMYIPILIAGIFFGFKYGVLAGVIGGIILGPLMPLVVDPYEQQEFFNWFYRLIIFIVVGGLSGFFLDNYKDIIKINNRLYSHHPNTGIVNLNYLYQISDDYIEGEILVATVLINNKSKISEFLGNEMYTKAMRAMYEFIVDQLPDKNVVIQSDSDKFWIMFHFNDIQEDSKKIVEGLTNQIEIEGIKLYMDFSIGISESHSFKECKTLIPFRNSDQLADYAKVNNLPHVIFDEGLIIRKYEFNLLSLFQYALKNNETYLVFHPIIKVSTEQVVGVEALIRWDSPKYGLVMPNNFIPLVESTHLIHSLTEWVIKNVLQFQNRVKGKGFNEYVSINLSTKNITNPNFYKNVMKLMDQEEGQATKIIFELTETAFLKEEMNSKSTIEKLKQSGFKIAIDDFGKGYSSLSYLSQFETDCIKIDKSFIDQIISKESIRHIVEAIVKLAHQFNLKVIAEGVETQDVYDKVRELGIDYIQGYYFSKPMKEEIFMEWYINRKK